MAKITVAGQAIVVKSSLTLDDIEAVKKYRPDALTLYKGEGSEKEPDFMIGITSSSAGCIGTYGVEFSAESHDEEKHATVTMLLPNEVDDVKGYVADQIGSAVLKLAKLEESLPKVIEEIAAEREKIGELIHVAG